MSYSFLLVFFLNFATAVSRVASMMIRNINRKRSDVFLWAASPRDGTPPQHTCTWAILDCKQSKLASDSLLFCVRGVFFPQAFMTFLCDMKCCHLGDAHLFFYYIYFSLPLSTSTCTNRTQLFKMNQPISWTSISFCYRQYFYLSANLSHTELYINHARALGVYLNGTSGVV